MNHTSYLFFDCECANCFDGIGKICSLGYVLADDELNIIMRNKHLDVMIENFRDSFENKHLLDIFVEPANPLVHFVENLKADKNVLNLMSNEEIDECFDMSDYLKNIDEIYKRF